MIESVCVFVLYRYNYRVWLLSLDRKNMTRARGGMLDFFRPFLFEIESCSDKIFWFILQNRVLETAKKFQKTKDKKKVQHTGPDG